LASLGRAALFVLALLATFFLRFYETEPPQTTPVPDAIFYNGHIVTMNAASPAGQAIAISNGKFIAVGSSRAIEGMAGPNTRRLHLQGRTVLPGLADGPFS
jgi:adenine deaminase